MSPQVDFEGRPVIPKEPENNTRTTRYYGGYEERPDGTEKWTLTVDAIDEWYCDCTEFDKDNICHGCSGEKGDPAKCEALNL